MRPKFSKTLRICVLALVLVLALAVVAFAEDGGEAEYVSNMYGTFWSLVPPIIAIALALITKEVYSSLFVGILFGALFYSNFNPGRAIIAVIEQLIGSVSDGWNVGILIFLVVLGIIVSLMNTAGGSAAYGEWAGQRIKTRTGAQLSTLGLGVLIFVDDYFNCLTVGSVMMPITDKHKISRAKLAYLIDSTAAPVCIIAPISSWAAAVSGLVPDGEGFTTFVRAIPYNFYALLTLLTIVIISVLKMDIGPMKRYEKIAQETGNLFGGGENEYAMKDAKETNKKGKVVDLILPVVVLILSCIICMIYTGGFFDGETFVDSFANCDASIGLSLGSLIALILIFIFYMVRRVLTFKEFADCLPDGFRAMVPAIFILIFAWTLSGFVRGSLGAGDFVANNVAAVAQNFAAFLPSVFFLIACGVSFATGTSWGTFGILIPIALAVFQEPSAIQIISISACMGGAVMGDHCSPISDTTIMSSTGAQSNHIQHVSTQMPYALTVAAVSFVSYIFAGFLQNAIISLLIAIVLMVGTLLVIRAVGKRKAV